MAEAYIVDALRTPTGKRKGSLSHVHGADLGAAAEAPEEPALVPHQEDAAADPSEIALES